MMRQSRKVEFFEHTSGLTIPFTSRPGLTEVGCVGPYSMAVPHLGATINQGDYLRCWKDFTDYSKGDILVRLPPESHFPRLMELNQESLSRLGFQLKHIDHNSTIEMPVWGNEVLRRARIRDLGKASELDLIFEVSSIEAAYKIIELNRKQKKLRPALPLLDLKRLADHESKPVNCHVVLDGDTPVSGSISLEVNDDIAYVFMWGHDRTQPAGGVSMTFLASKLVNFYSSMGKSKLCLGVSSAEGIVDEGLLRFKTSIGGNVEPRLTYLLKQ
jgi:hypothetical protein